MSARIQDTLFWLLCIAALLGNAAIFRARASEYAAGDPVTLAEANRILRAFVLYLGGLFLLLVVGTVLELTGPLIEKRAGPLTAFDLVYLVLTVAVLARATWWVYMQGGAELLAKHHKMFRYFPTSRCGVMFLWAMAMLACGYGIFERVASVA